LPKKIIPGAKGAHKGATPDKPPTRFTAALKVVICVGGKSLKNNANNGNQNEVANDDEIFDIGYVYL